MSQLHDANQRTKRTDPDNSYWDYGYDSLGQVTNAVRRWADGTLVAGQQYGYQFDTIGNRKTSGIGVSPVSSVYSANLLNQYTQRTVPGAFWETGSAHSNATVAVASHLDDMVTSQWQGFDRRWHGLDQSRRPVLQTAHQRSSFAAECPGLWLKRFLNVQPSRRNAKVFHCTLRLDSGPATGFAPRP